MSRSHALALYMLATDPERRPPDSQRDFGIPQRIAAFPSRRVEIFPIPVWTAFCMSESETWALSQPDLKPHLWKVPEYTCHVYSLQYVLWLSRPKDQITFSFQTVAFFLSLVNKVLISVKVARHHVITSWVICVRFDLCAVLGFGCVCVCGGGGFCPREQHQRWPKLQKWASPLSAAPLKNSAPLRTFLLLNQILYSYLSKKFSFQVGGVVGFVDDKMDRVRRRVVVDEVFLQGLLGGDAAATLGLLRHVLDMLLQGLGRPGQHLQFFRIKHGTGASFVRLDVWTRWRMWLRLLLVVASVVAWFSNTHSHCFYVSCWVLLLLLLLVRNVLEDWSAMRNKIESFSKAPKMPVSQTQTLYANRRSMQVHQRNCSLQLCTAVCSLCTRRLHSMCAKVVQTSGLSPQRKTSALISLPVHFYLPHTSPSNCMQLQVAVDKGRTHTDGQEISFSSQLQT